MKVMYMYNINDYIIGSNLLVCNVVLEYDINSVYFSIKY